MTDFTDRTKLLTLHLPCGFDLFTDVLKVLSSRYPEDAKWSDCQESDGETITFYAPA